METHICVYCGQPATHQFKNGKWCCKENSNLCPEMRRIRSEKAKIAHQKFKEKYGDARAQRGQSVGRNPAHETKYPSRGDHVCVYCGGHAEYQLKDGRWCCQPRSNSCPIRRKQCVNKRNPDGTPNRDYKKWWKDLPIEKRHLRMEACNTKEAHEKGRLTKLRRFASGELKGGFLGKRHTKETKRKQRLAFNRRLMSNGKYNQVNFSQRACEYIDRLNRSKGWHLQHALNGGELCVEGYHLDGYDKELNIAFEYDERRHYQQPDFIHLKQKDVERMNEIRAILGCRFFRYNEKLDLLYEVTDFGTIAQFQAEAMD